jgi:hypothetical protein
MIKEKNIREGSDHEKPEQIFQRGDRHIGDGISR